MSRGYPPGGAVAALRADGQLHLQHGPIDLLIRADAPDAARRRAYAAAVDRFDGLLEALVSELAVLRTRVGDRAPSVGGAVARRMVEAVWPLRSVFITPMAAVAGAVADEILAAMCAADQLERACVNNGGDIALHLAPGARYRVGVVGDLAAPGIDATIEITADDGIGGVATSGWRGRSHSLGIAESVTVLAHNAAAADAGTKPIAMAVTIEHEGIVRRPASALRPESDLGDLPVVVAVPALPPGKVAAALDRGAAVARSLRMRGVVLGAYLQLQAQSRAITPD